MQPGALRERADRVDDFINAPIWLYLHPVVKQSGELVFDNYTAG